MKNKILPIALLGALTVSSVKADSSGKWSAGAGISSLGLGASVAYKLNESFKVRGIINYFQLTRKFTDNDLAFHVKLRLFTAGVLGDWHALQNGFRLTGGLAYNGNQLNGKITPSQNVNINGRTYTPGQIGEINGSLSFRPIAPYIGVGFDSGHENKTGFSFTVDAGILFQGSVRGKVNSLSGQAANNQQAINDMKDDVVNTLNNKERWLKTYPVVSFGVSYKF